MLADVRQGWQIEIATAGLATSALGLVGIGFLKSYLEHMFSIGVFAVRAAFTTASIPPLVSGLVIRKRHG